MIITSPNICRGFMLCSGYASGGTQYQYTDAEFSENGKFVQLFYGVEGTGKALDENGNEVFGLRKGGLYDFRDYYNKPLTCEFTSPSASWITINPLPANNFFTGEVLKAGEHTVVGENNKEKNIICVRGSITINDKQFKEQNYARVLHGKTAQISIPFNCEALLIVR